MFLLLFLEAPGIVSSMITYIHISDMLADKSRLTSLLMSFCRINSVCRSFQELKKMGCFFLLVRSSISYTYAWPVFCWAVSSKHGLFPFIRDKLTFCLTLLSLYPTAIMFTAYLWRLIRGNLKMCSNKELSWWCMIVIFMTTHLRCFGVSSL